MRLMIGGPHVLDLLAFGAISIVCHVFFSYERTVRVLKWLTLALFSYVAVILSVSVPWREVVAEGAAPWLHVPPGVSATDYAAMVVAVLGTTISPYLFFWQASQEVEEEKAIGRTSLDARRGASQVEITRRKLDVGIGTFFSNLAMFFIILTTAITLHPAGITEIDSGRQVAQALEPLAGKFSSLLYLVGIVGTGALAIPTLAGSAAYALSELVGFPQGIDEHLRRAPAFYAVIFGSLACGVVIDFLNVSAVKALYWTAVINGLLAPVLLIGILLAASDKTLMNGQPSSRLGRVTVMATTVVMIGAAVAMFVV
jgi:Mn2+/Fe2+ NRAMP family transporter